jgi:hypothetical protein
MRKLAMTVPIVSIIVWLASATAAFEVPIIPEMASITSIVELDLLLSRNSYSLFPLRSTVTNSEVPGFPPTSAHLVTW